jgi:Helix-turn-helix domain
MAFLQEYSGPRLVTPEYLTTFEASRFVRLSQSSLAKLRVYGGGPLYLKIGRKVLYRKRDLEAWFAVRQRDSTSQGSADV